MKRVTVAMIAAGAALLLIAAATAQVKAVGEKGEPLGVPRVITKVDPVYPPEAKAEKVMGSVVLQIQIDEKGKVAEAKASKSPDERLSKAAIDAVKQWEFEPVIVDDKAVKAKATITINFRLK